jgi:hypothetical protein
MQSIKLTIQDIPHGHGLSFKRGVADGLLESQAHETEPHETHRESYRRGVEMGQSLKAEIAQFVKP